MASGVGTDVTVAAARVGVTTARVEVTVTLAGVPTTVLTAVLVGVLVGVPACPYIGAVPMGSASKSMSKIEAETTSLLRTNNLLFFLG